MMKKKLAMLLAVVMTVTSIESSAFVVSGADFGSDPIEVTAEAEALPETLTTEPEEEIFAAEPGEQTENGAAEVPEEGTTTSEVPEAEVLFGSGEEETAPETEEQTPEVPDISEEVILQEENTSAEEGASQEAVFSDGELTVEEDFAAEAGTVIPQDGVTPLELSVDYPVNIATPGEKVWFSFTPSETGRYNFSSTSEDSQVDAYGFLYDAQETELSSDDQSKGSNNDFLLTWDMEAGQTYYYCAKSWYEDRTGFFTVRLEKQRTIEAVKVDNIASDVTEGFDRRI